MIGKYYLGGRGIEANLDMAVKYFEEAAAHKNVLAMYALARFLEEGLDIYGADELPEEYIDRAFDLYTEAANAGNVDSMWSLLNFYAKGERYECRKLYEETLQRIIDCEYDDDDRQLAIKMLQDLTW